MNNKYLIVVVGPTASGKTALGIKLAKYFNTEIISADSRQIYKGLYIGTAQPTYEERSEIKHHLIDFIDLDKKYTVKNFENDSLEIINKLFSSKDILLVVGGTGLYIDALCNGIDDIPNIPEEIESEVNILFKEQGKEKCVEELKKLDNNCNKHIDLNNQHRVIRALKVIKTTGKPIYDFFGVKKNKRSFVTIFIGINLPKETLKDRIIIRTNNMIKNGLLKEAENFIKYKDCNSLQTIGYKEIYEYILNKKQNIENTINDIIIHTSQYAKRQMTWFKKNKNIFWLTKLNIEDVINYIEKYINQSENILK